MPHRRRVLVVDDVPDVLDSVLVLLERVKAYVNVHSASNGEQALDMLQQNTYDLVIADYRMPRVDGFEVLARARERSAAKYRVVMSAYGDVCSELEPVLRARPDAIVRKPFNPAAFLLMVMDFLNEHEREIACHRAGVYRRMTGEAD